MREKLDERMRKSSIFVRKRLVHRLPGQGLLNPNRNWHVIVAYRHFSGVVWTKNIWLSETPSYYFCGVACGVSQGSVLGPLFFLLYINDMQESSDKLSFYLFADDTNILFADKNLKSLELSVNQELNKVYEWLTANKLTLNIKKSNFVIFFPAQRKLTYQPKIVIFDFKQNKVALEHKDYAKYLGILSDKICLGNTTLTT